MAYGDGKSWLLAHQLSKCIPLFQSPLFIDIPRIRRSILLHTTTQDDQHQDQLVS